MKIGTSYNEEDYNECEYCYNCGTIYTCLNCGENVFYDSEFGVAICDNCYIQKDSHNVTSRPCNHCNLEE